ncbi:hypothetical protein CVIRNUC_009432 [Coccomyxa viridis]|uniref:Photosystem II 11 kDa protein n=1 Tax=Coccomyxa viridis TaxID=1274662 RepID=A0AAV1IGL4_9CHLO|nr:hypothetical protein CVIRNUC_009432 [Coccomyxa viridis]
MALLLPSSSLCARPFGFAASSRSKKARCHNAVMASASARQGSSCRRDMLGSAAAVMMLVNASKAEAFLGIGENSDEVYKADTSKILEQVRTAISLGKEDAAREAAMEDVRKATMDWVAKYRRAGFTGRPSYGNTYTALNALAGHFNSFGTTAPLPKKRLERIEKELDDATKMLGRGR